MKRDDIYRIKGTTEHVQIVRVNGNNIGVRKANGTCISMNIENLALPIKKDLQWMQPIIDGESLLSWAFGKLFSGSKKAMAIYIAAMLLVLTSLIIIRAWK